MKLPHAASNRGQCSNSQPEGRPRPSQRQEAHIPPCSYFHSVHAIGSPAPSLLGTGPVRIDRSVSTFREFRSFGSAVPSTTK